MGVGVGGPPPSAVPAALASPGGARVCHGTGVRSQVSDCVDTVSCETGTRASYDLFSPRPSPWPSSRGPLSWGRRAALLVCFWLDQAGDRCFLQRRFYL